VRVGANNAKIQQLFLYVKKKICNTFMSAGSEKQPVQDKRSGMSSEWRLTSF